MSGERILILGGGASGTMLAAHLLRRAEAGFRVTLIERESEIGRGIAYSTVDPDHVLNTRVASMSAYPDEPDHFWRWLLATGAAGDARCDDPFSFVPRRVFARYLADLVRPWRAENGGDGRLTVVAGECAALRETGQGVAVELADGTLHVGRAAVLATGHARPKHDGAVIDAWTPPRAAGVGQDDAVLILGTGLSMVDAVIGLANGGHRGPVTALSRHALLPRVHAHTTPLRIDAADMPFGTDVSYLLAWFRRTAAWAAERGGDWRDVMDGVRPHTAALWQSLGSEARLRFLRHARAWWEVHRHRLPQDSEERLRARIATGHLAVVAGRLVRLDETAGGARATLRRRGAGADETLEVAKVIDCTGLSSDPAADPDSFVGRLVARGTLRSDGLRMGLDVDGTCATRGGDGKVSARLFAVGPLTKGVFWEVTAVPDIRLQCAALAAHLARAFAGAANAAKSA